MHVKVSRLFLSVAMVVVTSVAAAPQRTAAVRISYSLVKTDPSVHEPLFLQVALENGMDGPVTVDLGPGFYGNFEVKLIRPDGRIESWPNGVWSLLGAPGVVTVPAHGEAHRNLLLNRWFDFDTPGRYILNLKLRGNAPTFEGAPVAYVTEGEVEISIGSRNPARLNAICAELEKEATDAPTLAGAWESVETLSHVRDPLAVPRLAALLSRKEMLRAMLIKALETIGDSSAADVLISHIHMPGDTAELSRAALARIQVRSDDLEVRQKIRDALTLR